MKKAESTRTKTYLAGLVFVLIFSFAAAAQKKTPTPKPTPNANLPKVTQIDETGLKTALKPNGKPLLVNFWATWCDPCREEFPELVQIDTAYKGKIDFITISLDDLAEINRDVPKFLAEMKAEMPAFLLKTADESAVISSIAKDWSGGLPFTVLYNPKGEIAYLRQGKVKVDVVKAEIDKVLPAAPTTDLNDKSSDLDYIRMDYEKGKADARKDISNGILTVHTSGHRALLEQAKNFLREKYGISTAIHFYFSKALPPYSQGYNEVSKAEIRKRFGEDFFERVLAEANLRQTFVNVDELVLTVNYKS